MKTIKVSARKARLIAAIGPRELRTLTKYPNLLAEGKHLIQACRGTIKEIEALQEHANARKRETAHKRVVRNCAKALARVES